MNRLLLIPCVLSCLGFVFLAGSNRGGEAGAMRYSTTNTTAVEGVELFLSAEEIQEGLIKKWRQYNVEKYAFSRVYRPEQHYVTPGILVNETLPSPEGSFVGVFTLESSMKTLESALRNELENADSVATQEFPIVVDRRTGEAMVFASGQWTAFDVWAVAGS
jgi:hypothetical protein